MVGGHQVPDLQVFPSSPIQLAVLAEFRSWTLMGMTRNDNWSHDEYSKFASDIRSGTFQSCRHGSTQRCEEIFPHFSTPRNWHQNPGDQGCSKCLADTLEKETIKR